MGDDFKLQPKHYYIALAFVLFFFSIFAIDAYNSSTYEDPIGEIKLDIGRPLKQVEVYQDLDTGEYLYHEYGVYDSGWEKLDG